MHRLSVITSLKIMSDETIELPKNDLEIMADGRKNSKTSISGILHVLGFYLPPLMDTCSESPASLVFTPSIPVSGRVYQPHHDSVNGF